MWKVSVGIALALLGVAAFVVGLQYSSFIAAGGAEAIQERYELLSRLFGYGSYVLFIGGVTLAIWGVRSQNKVDRARHSSESH
jgi:uncharacterized membrane protein